MKKQIKLQEKAIDEIINRYGEIIDLKKSPYLIIEIIQQFQGRLKNGGNAADCLPPGGPPPKRGDDIILLNKVLKEISSLSKAVKEINAKINRLKK
jgi:hypothetical protein